MLLAMPWINCFHFNGPCVNYLISGSNLKPWGATAILMCKVGGAYEFSACHSAYTILKNFQLSSLINTTCYTRWHRTSNNINPAIYKVRVRGTGVAGQVWHNISLDLLTSGANRDYCPISGSAGMMCCHQGMTYGDANGREYKVGQFKLDDCIAECRVS